MANLGSNGTEEAIQDAWDDATQLNNVVVMEVDSLSIVQGILEKVAAGKEPSRGECEWAGFIADYLNSRNQVASTSGPRQAGISEQLSIADRSKFAYGVMMFIHYTFRENALLISMGLVGLT
jgi:hypothetical protein